MDKALLISGHIFADAALKDSFQRIFIITNNDNPNNGDLGMRDRCVQKAEDLDELNIEPRVIPIGNEFSYRRYWRHVLGKFVSEDESQDDRDYRSCSSLKDINDAIMKKNVKKRSLASVAMEVGPDIKIGVKLYVTHRTASKESGGFLDSKTNEPLTTVTQWVCKATGTVLEPYQITKFFPYGGTQVVFSAEEMKTIKSFGDPGLTLMGFKPKSALEQYHHYRSGYFVFPDEKSIKGSNVAFLALVQEMESMGVIAVARMIYRKGSGPKFVALLPQLQTTDEDGCQVNAAGMHMVFLPFAEDIRDVSVSKGLKADETAIQAAKEIVKTFANTDPELEPAELPYQNPALQQHFKVLQCMALEEDLPEGEEEDPFQPDYDGLANNSHLIEAFNNAVGAVEIAEPEPKKTTKRKAAAAGGGAAKKAKAAQGGGDADFNWQELRADGKLGKLTIAQLKLYLRKHSLPLSGKKGDLVSRIEDHMDS